MVAVVTNPATAFGSAAQPRPPLAAPAAAISRITFGPSRQKLELFPALLTPGQVGIAHGQERAQMIHRQIVLSAELDTRLTLVGRHLGALPSD